MVNLGFHSGSEGKETACNVGDPGLVPGLGRYHGEGNGTPLQNSCLDNPMDGGTCQPTVHGVAKSWTQLSNFTSLTLWSISSSVSCSVVPDSLRPHGCGPPGSSVLGVLQARILEGVVISFSINLLQMKLEYTIEKTQSL